MARDDDDLAGASTTDGRGRNSREDSSDPYAVTADELRQFIEQVESQEAEITAVRVLIKETMAEAKARGYDTKIIRQIVRLRKKAADVRAEEEAILELYKQALNMT